MSNAKIVMDVWGGHHSQDHVARFIRSIDDAFELSRSELRGGFLVNLRSEVAWGDFEEFDLRRARPQ